MPQFFTIALAKTRKRWRLQFELAIRQVGNKHALRSPNHMARLMLLVTRRSLQHRYGWRSPREFLLNRQGQRLSRGFSNAAIRQREPFYFRRSQTRPKMFARVLHMGWKIT